MVSFYHSEYELAQQNVLSQNRSLASVVNGRLTRQQYLIAGLSQDKGLAEIGMNILYSQFVDKKIQQFVQQTPLVKAAFIIDRKGFLLSGYPLDTLKIGSSELTALIDAEFKQSAVAGLPVLHFLSIKALSGYMPVNPKRQGQLAFFAPLKKAAQSLVTTSQTTAVLVTLLDAQQLLLAPHEFTDKPIEILNQLFMTDQPLLSPPVKQQAAYFTAHSPLDYQIQLDERDVPLGLVSYHRKSDYLFGVYRNIFMTLGAIVILLILAYSLLKYWLNKLNAPIQEIVTYSQRIAAGNFQVGNSNSKFIEFQQIHVAMAKMATQIDKQLDSLSEARLKAESSDRLKSQFLANMSHEIRTPMNGVLGILQIMQGQQQDEQQRKMLHTAMRASQNLLAILNDILDFSKIEADQLVIEHIAFSPKEVVESVHAIIATECQRKGLTLAFTLSDEFEQLWLGDPLRLTQVLQNLLTNAVKFTPAGQISLSCQTQMHEGQHYLHFIVRDQGIGLTTEQLNALFTPFKQADSSTTRLYGGTGLGLSISHNLVSLMGGTLTVESQSKQGASFTFSVQVEPVNIAPTEFIPQKDNVPVLTGRRILLVEDNEINQEILKLMLAPTEADVWLVENGQQALDRYAQCQPELILMDVQMPIMDGLTATKHLREAACVVPIIFQTANISHDDLCQYRAAGADDVLAKPTDMGQLYRILTQFMLMDKPSAAQAEPFNQ